MEIFSWKESFNTGIDEVDEQHKRFMDCLNDCHRQFAVGGNKKVEAGLLFKLRKYAEEHFAYEEEFMLLRGYEGRPAQVRQHQFFRTQLAELEVGVAKGYDNTMALLDFLRDWFLTHILEEDRKYVGQRNPRRHLSN